METGAVAWGDGGEGDNDREAPVTMEVVKARCLSVEQGDRDHGCHQDQEAQSDALGVVTQVALAALHLHANGGPQCL